MKFGKFRFYDLIDLGSECLASKMEPGPSRFLLQKLLVDPAQTSEISYTVSHNSKST